MSIDHDLFLEKFEEASELFNIIKSKRRVALLQLVARRSSSLAELQHFMRRLGYDHSQTTILGYLSPLLKTGLFQVVAGRYVLTNRGLAAEKTISQREIEMGLPLNSNCDEEFLLIALDRDSSGYGKLLGFKPAGDFGRTVRRLESLGFISREKPASRVIYGRSGVEPVEGLSATEKRVYGLIPEEGATIHDLSWKASTSVRRAFKYLRLLRDKGLVNAQKPMTSLTLTPKGGEYASLLKALAQVLESTAEVSPELAQGNIDRMAINPIGVRPIPFGGQPQGDHEVEPTFVSGKRPCDQLRPLNFPGLSGQKLFHCGRYDLTIGENPAVCETCCH